MDDINIVILSGVIVGTPEITVTKNGKNICSARIKSVRTFVYNDTPKESSTTKDLKAFGRTAEFIGNLRGGDRIRIQGRLATESWADKTDPTKKKYKEVIEVSEATGERANETQTHSVPQYQPKPAASAEPPAQNNIDDSVPF